jgi:hypothetical protein
LGRTADSHSLERLDGAVRRMGESLAQGAGDATQKHAVLRNIFRVNHETGRIARESPSMGPALRDLQMEVNFVTIQVKGGGFDQAREGFGRVVASLERVRSADMEGSRGESPALRKNL